ncbi:hypothetical protein AWZ03_006018 [Drosophila navojoa]|uniref:Metallo-beta-lactamase domain-containing protein n=1 Tax=Drosophila navojoa TaxID=7232 RepID=A0A484BFR0_DRONA|nr:hypothetical protein AWZ03_006018 [Drosophila navojoa]
MLESVNDDWKRIHTSTLSRASLQSIAKASIGETLTGRLIQAVAQNVRKDVSQVVAEAAKYARRTRSSKITMDHLLFALEELNISLDLLHVNYAKPDPIEADKPISKPPIKKSSINRVSRKYSKIRKREREEQYEPYDSNAPLEERKRWLKRERVLLMSNKRFPLSKEQQELYLVITEACMGSSESARREALQSLRTDSSLQPMLYRLSLFICEAIKVNVAQQNFALLIYLMRMVQNLLANPHLQLHNYLHLLVPSLLSCAVTRQLCPFPKAQDQLAVREYATTVMADLIRAYGYLGNDILSRVISVYKTGLKSSILMTIYGSLIGLGKMEVQGSNDAGARSKENGPKERKRKRCPSYKIVEDTTFVVDGFQFGDIPNATHYFLSHYHADHYVGLTRKFAHPLYMSPITAKLVRTFIPIDNQYMHEIDVGESITLNEVEITALDANHCPGAIMLMFKFTTGKCILHTGDFRATFEMESLPIFWNEPRIDVLYLDTTYLSKNYDFCLQSDSIDRICTAVRQFHEKNADKRILHVCGSYLIGKEKVWLALVEEFRLRVWTEPHRRKAIDCLDWPELQLSLCDDPLEANLHVINMGKISYPSLDQYFKTFEGHYDMLIGIRPSGWEKNSKPSYGKRISVIGVEYSEHSSYKELERFVRFLKPNKVISTVPVGKDLCVTGTVPTNWYKYEGCGSMLSTSYQPSITTFLETSKRSFPALANTSSDMSVSPLKNESTINTANNEDLFEAKQITEDSANVNVPAAHHLPAKRITSDASSDLLSLI